MSKKVIFTDKSNSLLNSYLKEIAKFKVLPCEEVLELVKLAQQGDTNARDLVIKSNLRFVVTVAKQFQNRGVDLMDLISSGNEGLCKSVDKFDSEKGVAFLSYAVWWIKHYIYNAIYWHGREIRLPVSQQILVISILDATNKFLQANHRNPSPEELSEITNIPREQIDYLSQFSNKILSVDDYMGGDEDNSQLCEVIPEEGPLLDDIVDRQYVTSELERLIKKLSIREHDVITMLFGIGMDSINNQVIANMYGIGTERIRQIKESGLKKLKRRFTNTLNNIR